MTMRATEQKARNIVGDELLKTFKNRIQNADIRYKKTTYISIDFWVIVSIVHNFWAS